MVSGRVDGFELAGLVIVALGIATLEEETLDFVGGVERESLGVVEGLRVILENASDIRGVGRAVFVDDFAEDQNFAGAEDVAWAPVEGAPIHVEAKVTFALRGETADRGAVEGQIVPAPYEELLVVLEHVQAAS